MVYFGLKTANTAREGTDLPQFQKVIMSPLDIPENLCSSKKKPHVNFAQQTRKHEEKIELYRYYSNLKLNRISIYFPQLGNIHICSIFQKEVSKLLAFFKTTEAKT